jgi:hypothetical protein
VRQIVFAAAAILIVACSVPSRGPAPVSSLARRDEIAKIIGMAITEVKESGDVCEYHTSDARVFVTVRVARGAEADAAMQQAQASATLYQLLPKAPQGGPLTPPPELGKDAVYGVKDTLSVFRDGVFIGVVPPVAGVRAGMREPMYLSSEDKRQIADEIAAKVMARLRH